MAAITRSQSFADTNIRRNSLEETDQVYSECPMAREAHMSNNGGSPKTPKLQPFTPIKKGLYS